MCPSIQNTIINNTVLTPKALHKTCLSWTRQWWSDTKHVYLEQGSDDQTQNMSIFKKAVMIRHKTCLSSTRWWWLDTKHVCLKQGGDDWTQNMSIFNKAVMTGWTQNMSIFNKAVMIGWTQNMSILNKVVMIRRTQNTSILNKTVMVGHKTCPSGTRQWWSDIKHAYLQQGGDDQTQNMPIFIRQWWSDTKHAYLEQGGEDRHKTTNNNSNTRIKGSPLEPCRRRGAVPAPCQTCRSWRPGSDTLCPQTARCTGTRPWPAWNWPARRSCSTPSSSSLWTVDKTRWLHRLRNICTAVCVCVCVYVCVYACAFVQVCVCVYFSWCVHACMRV